MATIIWCDRARYIVEESRTQVGEVIDAVRDKTTEPRGFAFFTRVGGDEQQVALSVDHISAFEGVPGDGV